MGYHIKFAEDFLDPSLVAGRLMRKQDRSSIMQ